MTEWYLGVDFEGKSWNPPTTAPWGLPTLKNLKNERFTQNTVFLNRDKNDLPKVVKSYDQGGIDLLISRFKTRTVSISLVYK